MSAFLTPAIENIAISSIPPDGPHGLPSQRSILRRDERLQVLATFASTMPALLFRPRWVRTTLTHLCASAVARFLSMLCQSPISLLACLFAGLAAPASLQARNVSPQHRDKITALGREYWRAVTLNDVEAAYILLRDNHPGAVPQVGDTFFRATLNVAHMQARRDASRVTTQAGYNAVLSRFANSFHDAHIRARPYFIHSQPRWAGILLDLTDDKWTVSVQADGFGYATRLVGSHLISCDGRQVATLAKETLGRYDVDWTDEAQKISAASRLLVDYGNPFVRYPKSCVFQTSNGPREVSLVWQSEKLADLDRILRDNEPVGNAGFSVGKFNEGYWISLGSLDGRAVPVAQAVAAMKETLRAAPYLVLDLRGNGGGDSSFGRDIANDILGKEFVDQKLSSFDGCGTATRVSEGNIDFFEQIARRFSVERGERYAAPVRRIIEELQASRKKGAMFTSPLLCQPRTNIKTTETPLFRGTLFILTDGGCFSSCLTVSEMWKKLGALQLGRSTSSDPYYADVNDAPLPSGLGTFSTETGVEIGKGGAREGPFIPEYRYTGNIKDDASVRHWVQDVAKSVRSGL